MYCIKKGETMNNKAIGRNIQKYRLMKGLSQAEFAQLLGVTGSYVGKIEAGMVDLPLGKVQEISAVLNVNAGALTTF